MILTDRATRYEHTPRPDYNTDGCPRCGGKISIVDEPMPGVLAGQNCEHCGLIRVYMEVINDA